MTAVLDSELRDAIGRLFAEPIEIIDARPHPEQSSCALTEVSLCDRGGERRELLLKDLSAGARHPGPAFLYDELREAAAYRLLSARGLRTPRLLGTSIDSARRRCWLFIERVQGTPLWQSSDPADWCEAAAWLARLHELAPAPDGPPWLRYDAGYYARWMRRARAFAPDAELEAPARAHARALARLAGAKRVTVHGDFYPSNVLVRAGRAAGVCPLDFELAGAGAAVLDLAALTTGLSEPLALCVVDAYRSGCTRVPPGDELEELVVCARLHLAIRWLGWMRGWEPPEHQRFDWAAEARAAAAKLEGSE